MNFAKKSQPRKRLEDCEYSLQHTMMHTNELCINFLFLACEGGIILGYLITCAVSLELKWQVLIQAESMTIILEKFSLSQESYWLGGCVRSFWFFSNPKIKAHEMSLYGNHAVLIGFLCRDWIFYLTLGQIWLNKHFRLFSYTSRPPNQSAWNILIWQKAFAAYFCDPVKGFDSVSDRYDLTYTYTSFLPFLGPQT